MTHNRLQNTGIIAAEIYY